MNRYLFCALLSAVFSSFSTIGRWIAVLDLPLFFVSLVGWFTGALVLAPWVLPRLRNTVLSLSPSSRRKLAVLFFVAFPLNGAIFAAMPAVTTATNTALFLRMEPYLIMLFAWIFHRSRPHPGEVTLLTVHIVGALLIALGGAWGVSGSERSTWIGDCMAFAGVVNSALCYPIYKQVSQEVGHLTFGFLFSIASVLPVLILYLLFEVSQPIVFTERGVLGLVTIMLYSVSAVPLFFYAIRGLPSWKVSAFRVVSPVIVVPLAWLLLGEQMSGVQLLGAFLVLVTTIMLARQPNVIR